MLLLLSLLFFRGRATMLPLAVGMTTVLGTFLALTVVNQAYALSIFALNLVIGLGLGPGDRLHAVPGHPLSARSWPRSNPDAVRTTMRTAGRTVVFSAVTVAAALITLTVFPLGFLKSMGIAGAVVALIAGHRVARDRARARSRSGARSWRSSRAGTSTRRLVPARARRHAAPAAGRARSPAR